MTFNEIIPGLLAGETYQKGNDDSCYIFIGPFSHESDIEVLRIYRKEVQWVDNYVIMREDFWRKDWKEAKNGYSEVEQSGRFSGTLFNDLSSHVSETDCRGLAETYKALNPKDIVRKANRCYVTNAEEVERIAK